MIIAVKHYKRTLENIENRIKDLDYLVRVMGVANAYYAKNTQKQGECLKLQRIAMRGRDRYNRILNCVYAELRKLARRV